MSEYEYDKDIVLECFDELHATVGRFLRADCHEETFEAVAFLVSSVILARCTVSKTNVEQTMEETFDSIADYVYGMIEEDEEG